jgi:hypothetical protein
MCSHKVLVHNTSGYVIRCNACESFQVAFGTIVFNLSTENYRCFYNQVRRFKQEGVAREYSGQKRTHLQLPCKSVMLAVNHQELLQLETMLEESLVMNELDQLLDTHHMNQEDDQ